MSEDGGFVLEILLDNQIDPDLTSEIKEETGVLELVLHGQPTATPVPRNEALEFTDGRGPKGDPGAILLEADQSDAVAALIDMNAPNNVLVFRKVEP